MNITKDDFGKTSQGQSVHIFTLTNDNGLVAKITNFGGIVTEMHVPDKDGQLADITLGFDNLDGYLGKHPYFGAIVGRVANRIAKAKFELEGKEYVLANNAGENHLHGGLKGFDKVVWDAEIIEGPALKLSYLSKDGEENYPGNLSVTVVYSLTNDNELKLDMTAAADAPTPVNIVNHAYWNLKGAGCGDILDHEIMINAESFTAVDNALMPTGKIEKVAGTPLDFTKHQIIGSRFDQLTNDPLGYDFNFVLNGQEGQLKLAAKVGDPSSGRVLEVHTTEPGVQFYTGNFLDGSLTGKGGAVYEQYAGFCLETQHFPDSVNQPNFPSIILCPGQTYKHEMIHKFYAE